jgi:hypothetical protein
VLWSLTADRIGFSRSVVVADYGRQGTARGFRSVEGANGRGSIDSAVLFDVCFGGVVSCFARPQRTRPCVAGGLKCTGGLCL